MTIIARSITSKEDNRQVAVGRASLALVRGIVSRIGSYEFQCTYIYLDLARLVLLRLYGSRTRSRPLSTIFKHQLILDQMAKDPAYRQGPDLIKEHLISSPTKYVATTLVDSSYASPQWRRLLVNHLSYLAPIMNGLVMDMTNRRAFASQSGIRDKWSGKWPGLWVVVRHRQGQSISTTGISGLE